METKYSNAFIVPIGIGSSYAIYNSYLDIELTIFSPIAILIVLLSLIYFLVDFILMIIYYDPKNKIYFVHHLIGLLSIYFVIFQYNFMIEYLMSYLMFELSTPFLNSSKYYHKLKNDSIYFNVMYIFSLLLFILTFFVVRIVFGTYLLLKVVPIIYNFNERYKYIIILPITLQYLNYFWFYKIIKMIFKNKTD
ncbi:membrane protein [Moumouvirus goulette]|uniref:Membrane protein n=1 Tax=Moumouvirus goulette TaxID=1247379 RepID=M1PN14_9VIRU|nr:membrane protein [Moumouvirus goulette]AGF85376.1 membrane protein [Moumouvirus goulette]